MSYKPNLIIPLWLIFLILIPINLKDNNEIRSQNLESSKKKRLMVRSTIELPENWLERFNYYRTSVGLNPVVEDPGYSEDLNKHANYMLLNVPEEGLWHGETPDRPGYTPEGAQAAAESNLWFPGADTSPAIAIDVWMASLYHRYGMLKSTLTTTGFAMACDNLYCGTGLNVLRGLNGDDYQQEGVTFPGTDVQCFDTNIISWISWQFDGEPTAILYQSTLMNSEGDILEHEIYTPQVGDYFNIIGINPLEPYTPNEEYTVVLRVMLGNEELSKSWSFTTCPQPQQFFPILVRHQ
jgi:hypothetical protein